jgi:hypothetical protein
MIPETKPELYLVSRLWIDPQENKAHYASGYQCLGVVTKEQAKRIERDTPVYIGKGWPITSGEKVPILACKPFAIPPLLTLEEIDAQLANTKA